MGIPNFNLEPTLMVEDTATAKSIAYYSMSDAAIFVGLTPHGLIKRTNRFNKQHPGAPVYKVKFGNNARAKYYTQEDLHRLSGLTVVAK